MLLKMLFFAKGSIAVFMLHTCVLNHVNSLEYNELRNLNVSCYPRDSCHRTDYLQSQTEKETCECDASCYRRGTCCIDSPYVDPRPSTRNEICSGERIIGISHYYYFNDSISFTFFQVTRCDRSWRGSLKVQQLCEMEEPVDGVDLMVAIPVTNTYSGITYKNYYCALCNNDIDGSVLWDVGIYEEDYKALISNRFNVEERIDSSTIVEESGSCSDGGTAALVYNEMERFYGYWDYCFYEIPRFVWVTVTLTIPEQIQHLVKGCRSNLISFCSSGWTDVRTRILCGSYLGIIKGPPQENEYGIIYHQYFRNAHCALCNNVTNFEGFSCEPFSPGAVITTPTFPTSITILFGHLLSNNGCLGKNDKFVQGLGCRPVVCLNPQYEVVNGKCALQ